MYIYHKGAPLSDSTNSLRGLDVQGIPPQFGKAQGALWSGVEKAYTGSSTKKVFQRFRVEIDELEKRTAL